MYLFRQLKSWRGQSLRHRLLASSIATVLCFLTLLGYLSYRTGRAVVRHAVSQRNEQLATLVARDINVQFDIILSNLRLFTRQLETPSTSLPFQAQVMLELRRAEPLTYRALYLFDSQGHLLIHLADSWEDLLMIQDGTELIARPPISPTEKVNTAYKAAQKRDLFLSTTDIVGADQVPIIHIGFPAIVGQEQPHQVVVAEIDLRNIWRRIDQVRIEQTGRAFVVSREGIIIAHPDRAYIEQPLATELRQVLAGYEGHTEYIDPIGGRAMLAAYSPVGKASGLSIVVEQEQAEAFDPVNEIASITLRILLTAGGMATGVTVLVARSITDPIQQLVKATRTIAHTGELDQDVVVERRDEVGQLAITFNQMMASLRRARAQRDATLEELRAHREHLEELVAERTAELNERVTEVEQLNHTMASLLDDLRTANLNLKQTAKKLQEANKELADFAYVASHDLKAPLRAVTQLATWIADDYADVLDADGRGMLALLIGRTRRMHNLIEGILQYSRIGRVREEEQDMNLNQLVQETVEALSPPEHIRVTIDALPTVAGEPTYFVQIFQNLLSNAIKFMDKPQGRVSVDCVNQGSHWLFSVTDNGPGIEKKYHAKIFQIFQTLAPRDEVESTGIGLALVKKIVEMQGGKIWVESTLGEGSTFFFTWPRKG